MEKLKPATVLKIRLFRGCFARLTLPKWYQIAQNITYKKIIKKHFETYEHLIVNTASLKYNFTLFLIKFIPFI